MTIIPVLVKDSRGKVHEGSLAACTHCGWRQFFIYMIHNHQHIQCGFCEATFCGLGPRCGITTQPLDKKDKKE